MKNERNRLLIINKSYWDLEISAGREKVMNEFMSNSRYLHALDAQDRIVLFFFLFNHPKKVRGWLSHVAKKYHICYTELCNEFSDWI